jgi:hypothetical protein
LAEIGDDDVRARGVLSRHVPIVWPVIEGFIARALEYADGRYAANDILLRLLRRDMQLWLGVDRLETIRGVCVTEIVNYPRSRRCELFLAAGRDPRRWMGALDTIESWARDQGCDAIECKGRPGWERILPGYEKNHVSLKKELKNARNQRRLDHDRTKNGAVAGAEALSH